MPWFALASLGGLLVVALTALRLRGRTYATFAAVALGIFTALSVHQYPHLAFAGPLREYLQGATYLSFLMLIWPRMRSLPYRMLVSVPAAFHLSGALLSLPWALVGSLGFEAPLPWLPHLLSLWGVLQSLWTRESEVDIVLDGAAVGALRRLGRHREPERGADRRARGLRVVQITDPHLGPFMSVERLRKICVRAVARDPDLIVLTGDLLTLESHGTPGALHRALAPLSDARGRVFACMGNHDYEAPDLVRSSLAAHGIVLLMDEERVVETAAGRVQLLGLEHRYRGRREHLRAVGKQFPRKPCAIRLVLLHDPSAFRLLPEGEADLVLSGHTHGGQLGLLSFGLPFTFLSFFANIPDHGLWARGKDRLYVHRGTGHYGFPLWRAKELLDEGASDGEIASATGVPPFAVGDSPRRRQSRHAPPNREVVAFAPPFPPPRRQSRQGPPPTAREAQLLGTRPRGRLKARRRSRAALPPGRDRRSRGGLRECGATLRSRPGARGGRAAPRCP